MHLTWRDGVTTMLAVAVAVVAMAVVSEWGWPLLDSSRSGAVVVLGLGIGMCAVGNRETPSAKNGYSLAMGALGVGALGFGVAALITDAQGPFLALTVITLVMWAVSTTVHLVPARRHLALPGT